MKCLALLVLAAALATSGCTTVTGFAFQKEWRQWSPATPEGTPLGARKREPPPTPQTPWDGRWIGQWTSEKHGRIFSSAPMGGEARCVLTQIDRYRYRAHFRAGWHGLRSDYVAELYGKPRGKTLHLKGEFRLGRLSGGIYRYEGTVTPDRFTLHYDSSYDTGRLEMTPLR
jgi:hypothetical protein